MNVLVIGGAGYIGSHCVRQLQMAGHRAIVLDNLFFGHRQAIGSDVPFYEYDLGNKKAVGQILHDEKIDLVMHFAAFSSVAESVTNPLKYYVNNVVAVIRLLETMLEHEVKKFVFSSTCAIYGEPASLPIVETLSKSPINPYGQTKLDIENCLKAFANAYGLSFAVLRYFNAAGAAEDGSIGEDHTPESHLIPLVIQAAMKLRENITIFGTDYDTPDGTCLRDYVHVDDLSRAHIAVFEHLEKTGASLFYNLGTGRSTSVREVIAVVESVTKLKVPVIEGERRLGDPSVLYADALKAQQELGWKPVHSDIKTIIETAWRWHHTHPRGFNY